MPVPAATMAARMANPARPAHATTVVHSAGPSTKAAAWPVLNKARERVISCGGLSPKDSVQAADPAFISPSVSSSAASTNPPAAAQVTRPGSAASSPQQQMTHTPAKAAARAPLRMPVAHRVSRAWNATTRTVLSMNRALTVTAGTLVRVVSQSGISTLNSGNSKASAAQPKVTSRKRRLSQPALAAGALPGLAAGALPGLAASAGSWPAAVSWPAATRLTCQAATRKDRLLATTTASRLARLGSSSAVEASSAPIVSPALVATCMTARVAGRCSWRT